MRAKMNYEGLLGEVVGRLFIVEFAPSIRGQKRFWCMCLCGKKCKSHAWGVATGKTTSCGCLHKERFTRFSHGRSKAKDRTYHSWYAAKQRCFYKGHAYYDNYGGRGITMCARWAGKNGFENFLADMGERPEGKTLDRIDNEGNYSPENCQWATPKEQRANQRERTYAGPDRSNDW